MNELSYDAVERLLTHLERSGLMARLELSDEDIADAVWLALQMGSVENVAKAKLPDKEEEERQVIIEDGEITEVEPLPDTDSTISIYDEEPIVEETEERDGNKSLPFQAPSAPALQNKLAISRALRPLMRKVASATKTIFDAEATVTRIVEQDIWLPIIKPQPERWLSLELVVEESRSGFIWTETIDELQKLLQNHGAFRTVRVWSLSSADNGDLQLTRRRKGSQNSYYQHNYRELIHSDGRGLILFVSDCVSVIWQQWEIYEWLQKWSSKVPTAIIQLFPERLWESSELGNGYKLQLSAFNPGVSNYDLVLSSSWEELTGEQVLKLPVVTLEALSLKKWAEVLTARGSSNTPGFAFDLEFLAKQIKKQQDKTSAAVETEESPESLVDRFLATASPTAQRLAGLMAAVPVSLPIVNLIQKTFLADESTPVNVAEVFLSGMIQRVDGWDDNQNPQYDFVPGVRKILNQATYLEETEKVLDVLTSYISENLGLSVTSFTAFLSNYQDLSQEQQDNISLPFAEITIEVLKNLGGEYAAFAEDVVGNIGISASEPETDFDESIPELKTCTFKIATIEIVETRTFEFYSATLEQKSRFFGLGNRWVINRQERQATGIVEDLGDGIELELVEIPGGSFIMGAPEGEEGSRDRERPQHEVTVPSFFMGRYQVTQAQWKLVANLPQVGRRLKLEPSHFKGDNLPVERVSWYDAVEFCNRLSKHTGRKYRLPSEAEWEYACRAGTTKPFYFGETITSELVNYDATSIYGNGFKGKYREKTTPVGSFGLANAFGLYDMHGNVWEWCLDDWHGVRDRGWREFIGGYEGAPTDGSAWFDNKDNNLFYKKGTAVLRGGSWFNIPSYCRSAYRKDFRAERNDFDYYIGFRVVCGFGRT